MKIPEKIKIGGHWWIIKYPYVFKERNDLYGQCDDASKEIRITGTDGNGAKIAESSVYVTFLHELLHAIDYVNYKSIFGGDKDEGERKVDTLAECIYQVLIDNQFLRLDK